MVPGLAASQHEMIRDTIFRDSLRSVGMAGAAACSAHTIRTIRSNLRCFGSANAPPNRGGRRRRITPVMMDASKQRLLEKPGMY
jgi:hypothetical protein